MRRAAVAFIRWGPRVFRGADESAAGAGPVRGPFDARLFQSLVVALIASVIALETARTITAIWGFGTDDAYITLRYSRHLAEGHGIVWNVGEEPVEGYSNFLFMILGACAIRLGADPMVFLKIVSCLALAITCLILYRMARTWIGPIGATLPAMMLTFYGGTAFWAVSGLETTFYQMLVVASVLAFFAAHGDRREPDALGTEGSRGRWRGRWLAASGVLVALAGMTRPEGPLVGVALGVALLVDVSARSMGYRKASNRGAARLALRRGARRAAVLALGFAIPYGAYFVWRLGYFRRVWPNTVYCKARYGGDPFAVIGPFVTMAWPAFALAVAGLATRRRRPDARALALFLAVGLYLVAFYGVDPIISRMNRHFLTALALVLVLATVGLFDLIGRVLPRLSTPMRELPIAIWLLLAGTFIVAEGGRDELSRIVDDYRTRMEMRRELGLWLDERLAADDTFVIGDTGMVPYVASARVIDAYCLNSAAMTRPPISGSPDRFVDYVLAREPEIIVVHSASPERLDPHGVLDVYPNLVERDAFQEDYEHVHTAGVALFNYWVFERTRP